MFLDKHILHSPSESPQWKGATVVNGNNLLINIFYWLFSFYFLTFTILLFILPGILPQINHPHPILVSGIGLGGIQIKNRRKWLPVIGNTWGHVSEGISRIKEPTRLAGCVSVWRWEMGCWIGELLVVCITSWYEVFVWDKKKKVPLSGQMPLAEHIVYLSFPKKMKPITRDCSLAHWLVWISASSWPLCNMRRWVWAGRKSCCEMGKELC